MSPKQEIRSFFINTSDQMNFLLQKCAPNISLEEKRQKMLLQIFHGKKKKQSNVGDSPVEKLCIEFQLLNS
jgi:hypothetical protein